MGLNLDYGWGSIWIRDEAEPELWTGPNLDWLGGRGSSWVLDEAQDGARAAAPQDRGPHGTVGPMGFMGSWAPMSSFLLACRKLDLNDKLLAISKEPAYAGSRSLPMHDPVQPMQGLVACI